MAPAARTAYRVSYKTVDFPSGVPKEGELRFSRDELAHALFTTGRAGRDQVSHGQASLWEMLHRISLIGAYLGSSSQAHLTRSSLARNLDRSEKANLSYTLGQSLTGLFSRHVLKVPFLLHVDRYHAEHNLTFQRGSNRRPDLFGLTVHGEWVVAEAKGRLRRPREKLLDDMRVQKRTVATINSRPPALAYGCVASWEKDTLRLDAVDPIEAEPDAEHLSMDRNRYLQAYYAPFVDLIDREARVGEERVTIVSRRFPDLGISIGLRREIYESVKFARRRPRESTFYETVFRVVQEDHDMFRDGSFFSIEIGSEESQSSWVE